MSSWTFENNNNSNYLVYSLESEDELDTVALGMIGNNAIQGILPMFFMQNNEKRFVKYNITAKVTLKMFFEGVITRARFLNIISSVCSALMACDDYMLEMSSFLLDVDHIYVDVSTSKAYLICLPVVNQNSQLNYKDFFKNILFSSQFDQNENCDYIAKTISFLNTNQGVTLKDIKDFAEKLLDNNNQHEAAEDSPEIIHNTAESVSKPAYMPVVEFSSAPQPVNAGIAVKQSVQTAAVSEIKDPVVKKGFTFGFHKNKADKKQKEKHSNSGGGLSMAIPGVEPPKPSPTSFETSVKTENPLEPSEIKQNYFNDVSTPVNFLDSTDVSPSAPISMNTTVLSSDMLGNSDSPKLYRVKTNTLVSIDKPIFRIGKEASFVDYCISDNSAISRSHANIIQRGGEYFVVDANSTNHTYVNNMMIQANEEIKLEQGTRLRLANEEFEFRYY